MSVYCVVNARQKLHDPTRKIFLNEPLQYDNARAHCFRLTLTADDGTGPADLSDVIVAANFLRPDGGTVAIDTGTITENVIEVVLPAACYSSVGRYKLTVNLVEGEEEDASTRTAMIVEGITERNTSGTPVDPGTVIPSITDLIAEIRRVEESIPDDYSTLANGVVRQDEAQTLADANKETARDNIGALGSDVIAPQFSDEVAYEKGRFVWYEDELYQFTEDHPAGDWTGTDCTQVDDVTNSIWDAASVAVENVVCIQDEEPEQDEAKIWIPESSAQQVIVATYTDVQEMAQNVAVVQDETPVDPNTKFWIPSTSVQETQVPTYSEFQDLRDYMHHLEGKTLVCLGDSITYLGYADAIATATGMTVHNCGFSSGRMAKTSATSGFYYTVNYFGFFQLAQSIATGNWTVPDRLNSVEGFETQKAQLAAIKLIDFNEVDYVTIAYGTNDFASVIPFDNQNDPEDYTTYKGAIRYGVKQLLTAFPHLRILGVTPPYQFWTSGGVYVDDCTTHQEGGNLKRDYVQATIEGFTDMMLPYVDNFTNAGINVTNRLAFFNATDGTHPNDVGRAHLGRRIASAILLNY